MRRQLIATLSDIFARSGTPRVERIIHHGANELFIWKDFVPDGEITLPIQEGPNIPIL